MTDTMKALHGKLIRAEYELGRAGVAASQDEADKPIAVSLELVRECLATLRAALAPPADGAGDVEAEVRAAHKAYSDALDQYSGEEGQFATLADAQEVAEAVCLVHMPAILRLLSEERARRAEVEEALKPFALVAEHDIGSDEADRDIFRPMLAHNHAPRLSVGDIRRARAALNQETKP